MGGDRGMGHTKKPAFLDGSALLVEGFWSLFSSIFLKERSGHSNLFCSPYLKSLCHIRKNQWGFLHRTNYCDIIFCTPDDHLISTDPAV